MLGRRAWRARSLPPRERSGQAPRCRGWMGTRSPLRRWSQRRQRQGWPSRAARRRGFGRCDVGRRGGWLGCWGGGCGGLGRCCRGGGRAGHRSGGRGGLRAVSPQRWWSRRRRRRTGRVPGSQAGRRWGPARLRWIRAPRTWCPVSGWGTPVGAWARGDAGLRLRAARGGPWWRGSPAGAGSLPSAAPSRAPGAPGPGRRWRRARPHGRARGPAGGGAAASGPVGWTSVLVALSAVVAPSPLAASSTLISSGVVRCSWSDTGPSSRSGPPGGGRPARGRSRAQRPPRVEACRAAIQTGPAAQRNAPTGLHGPAACVDRRAVTAPSADSAVDGPVARRPRTSPGWSRDPARRVDGACPGGGDWRLARCRIGALGAAERVRRGSRSSSCRMSREGGGEAR